MWPPDSPASLPLSWPGAWKLQVSTLMLEGHLRGPTLPLSSFSSESRPLPQMWLVWAEPRVGFADGKIEQGGLAGRSRSCGGCTPAPRPQSPPGCRPLCSSGSAHLLQARPCTGPQDTYGVENGPGCSSVVRRLPRMHKALGLIPSSK